MYLRWLCTCKSFLVHYTCQKISFLYIVCFQIDHLYQHRKRKYQHHQFSIQPKKKTKKKIPNNEPLSPPPLSLPPPPSPPRPSSPGMVCTSSLIRASPNKNTKLTLFVSHKQNCVQGSLNSGAGRCLGNGPDFPLKFTCHLVRSFSFIQTNRSESIRVEAENSGGGNEIKEYGGKS